jgi:hypothetical protein
LLGKERLSEVLLRYREGENGRESQGGEPHNSGIPPACHFAVSDDTHEIDTDVDAEIDAIDVESIDVPIAGEAPGVDATVTVVGTSGTECMVLASMRRARLVEHEDIWAKLFVDDVFVDAIRATEVESGGEPDDVTFVARFGVPESFLDATRHRARVVFGGTVSRVLVRDPTAGAARHDADHEDSPQAVAAADFFTRLPVVLRRQAI